MHKGLTKFNYWTTCTVTNRRHSGFCFQYWPPSEIHRSIIPQSKFIKVSRLGLVGQTDYNICSLLITYCVGKCIKTDQSKWLRQVILVAIIPAKLTPSLQGSMHGHHGCTRFIPTAEIPMKMSTAHWLRHLYKFWWVHIDLKPLSVHALRTPS